MQQKQERSAEKKIGNKCGEKKCNPFSLYDKRAFSLGNTLGL